MSNEETLRRALEAISEFRDLTLIAPSLGPDADRGHQIGAHKAFSQAAEIAREALAATQELARFNGEQALAEWEGKPNWLQADNETVREWRDGDPMPAGKK